MAQFAAQGRLKLLYNGDGVSFRVEPRDPFGFKLVGIGLGVGGLKSSAQVHKKRRVSSVGSSIRVYSALKNNKKKSNGLNSEASLYVSDKRICDDDDDDYDSEEENDELACFRGLVLDISYRFSF